MPSTLLALTQPTSSNGYVVDMCCGNGWDQLALWTGNAFLFGSNLKPGAWNHVAITVSGTGAGRVRVYLNGVLVAGPVNITAGRNFNPNNSHPFRIGAWDGAGFGRNFDGTLDEVAFYSSALDANSISNHYYVATNNPAAYAAELAAQLDSSRLTPVER